MSPHWLSKESGKGGLVASEFREVIGGQNLLGRYKDLEF